MPREIHAEEMKHLLGLPSVTLNRGVMCLGLPDGTMIRCTAYNEYIHVEHWDVEEADGCANGFQTG